MAVRRYGPVRGAGTRVDEQEGDKNITPGALGFAGYACMLEKGPTDKLIVVTSKSDFLKKCGGIIADGQGPDACLDYFQLANGAGGLCLSRVTDGNEAQAQLTLYARYGSLLTAMGTVKAANGGRWGGKELKKTYDLDASGDLTEITLQLPTGPATAFKADEWKGGYIELEAVPNKRYPIVGNTAAGLITVAADQTMKTDWGAGPSLRFYLVLENESKALSIRTGDGEEKPDTEFSLEVFVDGALVKKWGNLSTDPVSARYWVNVINNDDGNDEIVVTDLWTGAHTAAVRPADIYGKNSTVTATVLTAVIHDFTVNSPTGGNPTFALGTTDDAMLEQTITITMTAATTGTPVSDKFGALGAAASVTLGTPFVPNNKWTPGFTVTAGATPLAIGDTLVIQYKPLKPDALIGGQVFPDKVNYKRISYRITDNDHKTITVPTSSDMTVQATTGDEFMVLAPREMAGGRDGHSTVGDSTYISAWDVSSSKFNDTEGKNLGLVKFATPGVTATAVQKAGIAYAEAKNHQYRAEVPAATVDENTVLNYVNDTIGRSDYCVWSFPSYGDVIDPNPAAAREGRRKTTTLTGMIHGREARIAADFDGYHKAEAGVDATLPKILKLPTADKKLNEELLNPAGIGVVKKKGGNYVLWGDRTAHVDPTWKFKHQREQMSYYEHVLQENFDFIVFSINDADSDRTAETALIAYFLPEWTKRALRGNTFTDAAKIKVDAEINTSATRANADKFAEVSLWLADTTERFIIRIGKQGIFESVA